MLCHSKPSQELPDGKFITTVKMGPRGQIVIPKEARDLYGLRPGESLLLLADQGRGMALLPKEHYEQLLTLFNHVFPTEDPS